MNASLQYPPSRAATGSLQLDHVRELFAAPGGRRAPCIAVLGPDG